MKTIRINDNDFMKGNKKRILILPIYVIFILIFEIIPKIGVSDIWDRLDRLLTWYNKDK